jgi:hypothetical protein
VGYTDRSDYARLCARIQELSVAGWSLDAIARQLEADGYPPLRRKHGWSSVSVQALRRQVGLGNTHRHGQSREPLGLDEWWGRELAQRLGVSRNSLVYWIEHGRVQARKESGGLQRWIVWANATELERLRAYRDRDMAAEHRRRGTAEYRETDHQKDRHHDGPKSSKRSHGWVVERCSAWLSCNRRLAKDYERKVQTSETWIELTIIRLLLRRLAGHAAPHVSYDPIAC